MNDNTSQETSWWGWVEGDQVWHTEWKSAGTIRIATYTPQEIAEDGAPDRLPTVVWHSTCVADELHEGMAPKLVPYTGQDNN